MKNAILFLTLLLPSLSLAQSSFTDAGYAQNFDGLDNFGTLSNGGRSVWRDDQTLDGWYTNIAPTTSINGVPVNEKLYNVYNDPSNGAGTPYALGSVGAGLLAPNTADRSLSFVGNSQESSRGPLYVALRLRNETGRLIDTIDLSYFGEIWSRPDESLAFEPSRPVTVAYRIGGSDLLDGSYTSAPTLGFVNERGPFAGGQIDGNAPENRVAAGGRLSGLGWQAGGDLWLRFQNPYTNNGLGSPTYNGAALSAIDDLRVDVVPVPEPATLAALGLGAAALLRRRRR